MTVAECAAALRAADDVLLLTHARPDGDTLGSAAALCAALRRLGKRAALYPNPEITESYRALTAPYLGDGTETFTVSVDVAGETLFPRGFQGAVALAIDHHPSNTGFAAQTLLCAEKASCGEIVMEVIETLCGDLTAEEANLLYAAVSTDCGCFCYANTTAETLRAAAHLLDCGADNHRLNKLLFRACRLSRLKLEGMIFSDLRSRHDGKINIAVVTQEMMARAGATEDDCDDLASLAGKVAGNVVAITVRELAPGRSRASVRTDGSVDANAVCARFGGGGHKMASGCTAALAPEALAEQICAAVEEQMT
ncbi:MAG: DHH family phosphoesterase [Oscillospiraceae bacterium]|nr:DHH family phosphoesterase [Oscillospiraceae bacterium]